MAAAIATTVVVTPALGSGEGSGDDGSRNSDGLGARVHLER